MIHSPPAKLEAQARPQIAGGKSRNQNYVQIVNGYANQTNIVHHKQAAHLVKLGRAEWIAADQLRLTEHPTNTAGRHIAARAYNAINDGFEWCGGQSGDATVMKATRGDPRWSAPARVETNA